MKKTFLKILACPVCKNNLNFKKNKVFCKNKHEFPVVNGIPRFVNEEKYTKTFGTEWSLWPKTQFRTFETIRDFSRLTNFDNKNLRHKIVVEFGCGPGRFLDQVTSLGGIAVGLEMSQAVDVAAKNLKKQKNIFLVQGDILNPPFKKNVFDHGFSIGVLHHTPNPVLGFENLVDAIKKGGKVIVSVYSKKGPYNYPSLKVARFIHKILKNQNFAVWYAKASADIFYPLFKTTGKYFSYIFSKYIFFVIFVKSREWRMLDVFDAITPEIATTHENSEVKNWFYKKEIKKVSETRNETSFIGIK